MLSDTLHDAILEIERHQKSRPIVYDDLRKEIGKVKAVMNALRSYLDLIPFDDSYPKYEAARLRLRNEIADIDVRGLAAAFKHVKASWPTKAEFEMAKSLRLGYEPEEVLARAIADWTKRGDRQQPSSADSEVDTEKHEAHLRNVNGLLATYKIGPAGELRRMPGSKEGT